MKNKFENIDLSNISIEGENMNYKKYIKYLKKWPMKSSNYDNDYFENLVRRIFNQLNYVKNSGAFDEQYYISNYPEVLDSDLTPLEHFFFVGFLSGNGNGKNPNANFDVTSYYEMNRNRLIITLNPFYHFLVNKKLRKSEYKLIDSDDSSCIFDRYENFCSQMILKL